MTKEENEGSGFFNRWSYRKALEAEKQQGVKRSEDISAELKLIDDENDAIAVDYEISDLQSENKPAVIQDEIDPTDESEREANHEAAKAVDLETLDYNSDYQTFLKKGVPDELTNQAMHKLWNSNPILANIDGLNDYDEDYGDPALNTFKSIWKVGRGFLTDADNRETIVNTVSSLDTSLTTKQKKHIAAEQSDLSPEQQLQETQAQEQTSAETDKETHATEEITSDTLAMQETSISESTVSEQVNMDDQIEPDNKTEIEPGHEPALNRVSLRQRLFEE